MTPLLHTEDQPTSRYSAPIILKSSVVQLLDGVFYGLDGETLYSITWLIGQFDAILNGKIVDRTTKKREGLYIFKGTKYSIQELGEIEKTCANDPQATRELQVILHTAKDRFIDLNKDFIKKIQGSKQLILKLMHESCDRRGIPDSFMLRWADTPFGQEQESFEKSMPSHTAFAKFLGEIINFMGDLYASCPKGRAQYLEILKRQRANK